MTDNENLMNNPNNKKEQIQTKQTFFSRIKSFFIKLKGFEKLDNDIITINQNHEKQKNKINKKPNRKQLINQKNTQSISHKAEQDDKQQDTQQTVAKNVVEDGNLDSEYTGSINTNKNIKSNIKTKNGYFELKEDIEKKEDINNSEQDNLIEKGYNSELNVNDLNAQYLNGEYLDVNKYKEYKEQQEKQKQQEEQRQKNQKENKTTVNKKIDDNKKLEENKQKEQQQSTGNKEDIVQNPATQAQPQGNNEQQEFEPSVKIPKELENNEEWEDRRWKTVNFTIRPKNQAIKFNGQTESMQVDVSKIDKNQLGKPNPQQINQNNKEQNTLQEENESVIEQQTDNEWWNELTADLPDYPKKDILQEEQKEQKDKASQKQLTSAEILANAKENVIKINKDSLKPENYYSIVEKVLKNNGKKVNNKTVKSIAESVINSLLKSDSLLKNSEILQTTKDPLEFAKALTNLNGKIYDKSIGNTNDFSLKGFDAEVKQDVLKEIVLEQSKNAENFLKEFKKTDDYENLKDDDKIEIDSAIKVNSTIESQFSSIKIFLKNQVNSFFEQLPEKYGDFKDKILKQLGDENGLSIENVKNEIKEFLKNKELIEFIKNNNDNQKFKIALQSLNAALSTKNEYKEFSIIKNSDKSEAKKSYLTNKGELITKDILDKIIDNYRNFLNSGNDDVDNFLNSEDDNLDKIIEIKRLEEIINGKDLSETFLNDNNVNVLIGFYNDSLKIYRQLWNNTITDEEILNKTEEKLEQTNEKIRDIITKKEKDEKDILEKTDKSIELFKKNTPQGNEQNNVNILINLYNNSLEYYKKLRNDKISDKEKEDIKGKLKTKNNEILNKIEEINKTGDNEAKNIAKNIQEAINIKEIMIGVYEVKTEYNNNRHKAPKDILNRIVEKAPKEYKNYIQQKLYKDYKELKPEESDKRNAMTIFMSSFDNPMDILEEAKNININSEEYKDLIDKFSKVGQYNPISKENQELIATIAKDKGITASVDNVQKEIQKFFKNNNIENFNILNKKDISESIKSYFTSLAEAMPATDNSKLSDDIKLVLNEFLIRGNFELQCEANKIIFKYKQQQDELNKQAHDIKQEAKYKENYNKVLEELKQRNKQAHDIAMRIQLEIGKESNKIFAKIRDGLNSSDKDTQDKAKKDYDILYKKDADINQKIDKIIEASGIQVDEQYKNSVKNELKKSLEQKGFTDAIRENLEESTKIINEKERDIINKEYHELQQKIEKLDTTDKLSKVKDILSGDTSTENIGEELSKSLYSPEITEKTLLKEKGKNIQKILDYDRNALNDLLNLVKVQYGDISYKEKKQAVEIYNDLLLKIFEPDSKIFSKVLDKLNNNDPKTREQGFKDYEILYNDNSADDSAAEQKVDKIIELSEIKIDNDKYLKLVKEELKASLNERKINDQLKANLYESTSIVNNKEFLVNNFLTNKLGSIEYDLNYMDKKLISIEEQLDYKTFYDIKQELKKLSDMLTNYNIELDQKLDLDTKAKILFYNLSSNNSYEIKYKQEIINKIKEELAKNAKENTINSRIDEIIKHKKKISSNIDKLTEKTEKKQNKDSKIMNAVFEKEATLRKRIKEDAKRLEQQKHKRVVTWDQIVTMDTEDEQKNKKQVSWDQIVTMDTEDELNKQAHDIAIKIQNAILDTNNEIFTKIRDGLNSNDKNILNKAKENYNILYKKDVDIKQKADKIIELSGIQVDEQYKDSVKNELEKSLGQDEFINTIIKNLEESTKIINEQEENAKKKLNDLNKKINDTVDGFKLEERLKNINDNRRLNKIINILSDDEIDLGRKATRIFNTLPTSTEFEEKYREKIINKIKNELETKQNDIQKEVEKVLEKLKQKVVASGVNIAVNTEQTGEERGNVEQKTATEENKEGQTRDTDKNKDMNVSKQEISSNTREDNKFSLYKSDDGKFSLYMDDESIDNSKKEEFYNFIKTLVDSSIESSKSYKESNLFSNILPNTAIENKQSTFNNQNVKSLSNINQNQTIGDTIAKKAKEYNIKSGAFATLSKNKDNKDVISLFEFGNDDENTKTYSTKVTLSNNEVLIIRDVNDVDEQFKDHNTNGFVIFKVDEEGKEIPVNYNDTIDGTTKYSDVFELPQKVKINYQELENKQEKQHLTEFVKQQQVQNTPGYSEHSL